MHTMRAMIVPEAGGKLRMEERELPEPSRQTVGSRVGVGWFGGSCGSCGYCRRRDSFACENIHGVTGVTRDGGYATRMLALSSALARVPDTLNSVESAPLLCTGLTTFNALRNCGAKPGDLVAIHGVGGLGHLGVQFAALQGFRTVAVNRGRDKEALARSLGAYRQRDSGSRSGTAGNGRRKGNHRDRYECQRDAGDLRRPGCQRDPDGH